MLESVTAPITACLNLSPIVVVEPLVLALVAVAAFVATPFPLVLNYWRLFCFLPAHEHDTHDDDDRQ